MFEANPYKTFDPEKIIDFITERRSIKFHGPRFSRISESAVELVRGLTCFNSKDRLSVKQALRHRWFAESSSEKLLVS